MKTSKYGVPEIVTSAICLAAVVLIVWLIDGWWRLAALPPVVFLGLVIYRGRLAEAWTTWKDIAHYIFLPVSIVLLTLAFVFGVGLTALFARLLHAKMLDVKFERRETYWLPVSNTEKTLEKIQRPF